MPPFQPSDLPHHAQTCPRLLEREKDMVGLFLQFPALGEGGFSYIKVQKRFTTKIFTLCLKPASPLPLSLPGNVIQALLQDGVSFKCALTIPTNNSQPCCPWPLCRSLSLAQRSWRLYFLHPFLGDEFFPSSLLSPWFNNTYFFHLALTLLHHSPLQDLPALPWLCHCCLSTPLPASTPMKTLKTSLTEAQSPV